MNTNFFRVAVVDVIYDPTYVLMDFTSLKKYYSEMGLKNPDLLSRAPRNAIIGKRILSDTGYDDGFVEIFFPFFPPHLSLPCKPGEHVWAFCETGQATFNTCGYWMCRIAEQWHVDDLNHTHSPRQWEPTFFGDNTAIFDFKNGIVENTSKRKVKKGSRILKINNFVSDTIYETLVNKGENQVNSSRLTPSHSVPRFKKRPGDLTLEGSNNTLIVLGTNRKNDVANYQKIKIETDRDEEFYFIESPRLPANDLPYGSIDIVVGRGYNPKTSGEFVVNSLGNLELNKVPSVSVKKSSEGNPDFETDKSRILLTERSMIDDDLNIKLFNVGNFSIVPEETGGIALKSDKVRIIARKDLEFIVGDPNSKYNAAVVVKSNGDIIFKPSENGYIKLGSDFADKAIMCSDLPATATNGKVSSQAIYSTGLDAVCTGKFGQGTFATKVLVE